MYSSETERSIERGDLHGARRFSRRSLTFNIVSTMCWLLCIINFIIVILTTESYLGTIDEKTSGKIKDYTTSKSPIKIG